MHRLSIFRVAILISIVFSNLFAGENDTTGVTFPIKVNWLQDKYAPVDIFEAKGLSMVSPDYISQNRHLWKIKLQGATKETTVDSAGNYIYFSYKLDGKDLYLPYAISLQEYYKQKCYHNLRNKIIDMAIENTKQPKKGGGGKKLELIGADIAGQRVALRVSGNINISGQMNNRKRSTVATNIRDGKSMDFKIDQKMRFNIEGTIGDRVSILVDQDSERSFDFENNMRIHYTGKEDEIIQKISAGNISLSLPGTRFVTFSSKNSGLFGVKADMKFGPVNLTTIASVEKGEKQKLSYDGGSKSEEIFIKDYNYVRNKYFFVDESFRETMWDDYFEYDRFTRDERLIDKIEVYKSVAYKGADTYYGVAYVDPNNPGEGTDFNESADFERLKLGRDYEYRADLGYIKFLNRVGDNEVIGIAYRVINENTNETISEYGDWNRAPSDTTDIVLKLIKPQSMTNNSNPCWDLMWRNVYSLGAHQIDSTGFDLQIVYDGASGNEERDKTDGETFIYKFGLDRKDAGGADNPDDIIDFGPLIRLYEGEVWFPYLEPFRYDETGLVGNPKIEKYNSDLMYDKSIKVQPSQINSEMKFKLRVKYANKSAVISLGPMVMEGSEEITLNGSRLSKGTDYMIDYFSGQLTILRDGATNPDAKLDIKYEKNSFFQLKKKTILGARAQYDFGPDKKNFIGATGLYYSKSVVDDKIDVGYEPMANFVFDINGRYQKDLNFMTKAIDRLPLLNTDKKSSFTFEGEFAQVLPNPNTMNNPETGDNNGVAYIDDFEGSKRTTSPVMTRNFWSKSAVPVSFAEETYGGQNLLRGHTYWYTDYTGIDITDVWPDKDVGRRGSDRTVSPLYLYLEPEAAGAVGEDAGDETKKKAWGGITYFFPSSSYDQSEAKFIDVWLLGNNGNLHIDMGKISEDQIPNGRLDLEDQGDLINQIYDANLDEDTGLDGVRDEEEYLIVLDKSDNSYDTLRYQDERLKMYRRTDIEDPALDNFKYTQGATSPYKLRTINGTENNQKDGAGGGRPDTENKNLNPNLDDVNNYKSITIDLSERENQCPYLEPPVVKDGKETGWKLYRIPLSEFENINGFEEGGFSWERIEALRFWLDGADPNSDRTGVAFAKVELVRNEWRSMGVTYNNDNIEAYPSDTTFVNDERTDKVFATTVKNTEENEDYKPPKGVEGEYDKVNEVQRKEQSLVLKLYDEGEGLSPYQIAAAEKDLLEDLSMINYKRMKMFVSGYNLRSTGHGEYFDGEKTPLIYFLRLGKGGANSQYYEIRQPVYIGWDDRNKIDVEIDFMTSLKKYQTEDDYTPKNKDGLQEFWILENDIRIYREVKDGAYTGKEILIYGTPATSRIRRMETGIINTGDEAITGEVWLDELRLSDVRKNPGTASRASFKINFADLGSFNMSLNQRDADFHTVEQQPSNNTGSLNTTRNVSTNANLNVHKFLPTKWGVTIPVTASVSQRESKPKYLPGTDILAGDNPPDSVVSLNESYGINTSFSKKTSEFWLTKYTIDQLRLKVHANWTESSNLQTKSSTSEKYSGSISYGIPFGRDNFVQPLKWSENIPIIGGNYSQMKLYYTPDKLSASASFAENKNNKDPRIGNRTSNHTMGLSHNYNFGYKLTDNIKATYSRKMKNNMNEIVDEKLENFKKFKFGTNETVNENYNMSFSPKIFSWLAPQFTYSSNYSYSDPIASKYKSIDRLSNSNTFNASTGLNVAEIFKSFYTQSDSKRNSSTGGTKGRSTRSRGRNRSNTASSSDKKSKVKDGHPFLDGVHKWLDKINTINVTYSLNNSISNGARVPGDPAFAYRLGFTQNPGLDTIGAEAGAGYDSPIEKTSLSLKSGLKLMKNVTTTFGYSTQESKTTSQTSITTTKSQDYFPVGENGKNGFPFPSYQVRISGIEKLPLLEKIFSSLSASHSYAGKENVSIRDTAETQSTYRIGFQPLFSMSMKFKNKMSSDFRITTSSTITNNPQGIRIADQMGASFSLNYKRTGGLTIPLPFMDKKRLDNTIDFSFTMEYNQSQSRAKQNTSKKFSTTGERSSLSLKPRIGYSFTNKVSGGVFFQYQKIDDVQVGERNNMNYGFDVNIAIRG